MLWKKAVFCLEVLIYKRLQMWHHNDVIGRNEYIISTLSESINFCLNPHVNHGDMKENVSGCFFLNTVYKQYHCHSITPMYFLYCTAPHTQSNTVITLTTIMIHLLPMNTYEWQGSMQDIAVVKCTCSTTVMTFEKVPMPNEILHSKQ